MDQLTSLIDCHDADNVKDYQLLDLYSDLEKEFQ